MRVRCYEPRLKSVESAYGSLAEIELDLAVVLAVLKRFKSLLRHANEHGFLRLEVRKRCILRPWLALENEGTVGRERHGGMTSW